MSYRKKLLLFLLSAIPFCSFAQTSSVSGTVKDGNEAVAGASVLLKGTKIGTTANERGYYELDKVIPGSYTLVISYLGYHTESRVITVKANQKLQVDVAVKKDQQQLNDVAISGKTKTQEIKESNFSVNAIDTKKFANTTSDLNQILNRTTGIRIREQGGLGSDFKFSINGLSGKQVKFFIDGIPLEVLGSAMSLNNIPVNLAERMEVYKGVVPVQLGADAMGGAVNVVTNQKVSNYLDVSSSYGSFNTSRSALTGQFVDKKTGLTLKASSFFNYSDNNYKMKDVEILEGGTRVGNEITDLNGANFTTTDVKRFHDHYKSAMGQIEAGVTNKKYADVLFAGFGYNEGRQDLQTGFDQSIVYGRVQRKSKALNGSVRYKKDNLFTQGLNLSVFAARSKDTYTTTDTLFRQYYWDGSWTTKGYSEMGGIKTVAKIMRPRTYAMGNLSYVINKEHSLNLNYTIDHLRNQTYNELLTDHDDMPGLLNKRILGFAYQQDLFDQKLVNTAFVKYYNLGLERSKLVDNVNTLRDTTFSNYGYGIASRYKIFPQFGVKASYEHAYRLQEAEEMFGDGLNLQANPDLKPERSENFNLGAYYNLKLDKHVFFIEASGFYRNAKDFIFVVPDQRSKLLKNDNKSNVRVTGLEAELRYNYANLLSFSINGTYQNAINTTRFVQEGSVNDEATYMNKIPNQPWLFGNLDFSIGKDNVLGKDTRLQFNWFTQYVQWFYVTWEAYGNANGKSDVPTQYVHNASLSYSMAKGKYNISAECRNLTDNLAYDNFRLQKPGRSASVKFRYFIQ